MRKENVAVDILREEIVRFSPYIPGMNIGEVKRKYGLCRVIKLASNENPLGTSPVVEEVIRRYCSYSFRYPEGASPSLREKLAEHLGMHPSHIVVGNGSDELIDLVIRVCCVPYKNSVVVFDPSFSIYRLQASFHGAKVHYVPLREDFSFNFSGMLEAVEEDTRVVFLTNPDNPSGFALPFQEIESFLCSLPSSTLLIVDEAYVEFAGEIDRYSAVSLVEKYPNVGVIRTFSKAYGLAGLRIGYGIFPKWLCDAILRVKLPFSVNILAEKAAIAALEDRFFLEETLKTVAEGRTYLLESLKNLGCRVFPSLGNFVMFSPPIDARDVFDALLTRGIIVRPLASYGLNQMLRVSVGRKDENRMFIRALKEVLSR